MTRCHPLVFEPTPWPVQILLGSGGVAFPLSAYSPKQQDIGARMSAVSGKADVPATWPESPFLARSRHSLVRRVLLGVLGADRLGARRHDRRVSRVPRLAQQCGVIFKDLRDVRMRRPRGLLPDRQGALIERLGVGVLSGWSGPSAFSKIASARSMSALASA